MLPPKKEHPKEKARLHPRNKHRERYDFKQLTASCPELKPFVTVNVYKDESVDFFNPNAVKALNKALLKHYYQIENWDIPENYLCPPVPGRADYIHYMADLLCSKNFGKMPEGSKIKCLDIGVGANCIYPIIGNREYGWSFIGADIDKVSIDSATEIVNSNAVLAGKIELKFQPQPNDIFFGIIQKDELVDLSVCNPPYHATVVEAQTGSLRKLKNLKYKKVSQPVLNFAGVSSELVCKGGEEKFVRDMVRQSKLFAGNCFWYSSLVSKQSHLKSIYEALETAGAVEVKTIPIGQGSKSGRIVAWTFLSREQQIEWAKSRWSKI